MFDSPQSIENLAMNSNQPDPPSTLPESVSNDTGVETAPKLSKDEMRYRQALRVGYVEMERIVEEIIVSEFTRIGEVLLEYDYKVEVVVFDTECEFSDKVYICGAGLRITSGYMTNAIVYTGCPHSFQFVLQTTNFANKVTEEYVEYHKLTPIWFHRRVRFFIENNFRKVDLTRIDNFFTDAWDELEGPFSVKMMNKHGYYNEIAKVDTVEEAFQLGSYATQGQCKAEDLLLVDINGKEFC